MLRILRELEINSEMKAIFFIRIKVLKNTQLL